MAELRVLVKIEDPTLGLRETDPKPVIPDMKPADAYAHGRIMYLKYTGVYKKLERAYRGLVQPQKRAAVAATIEAVLTRMVQMHAIAVKYAPLNPEVAAAAAGKPYTPLPWSYVVWDDLLTEVRGQPEDLDLPPPCIFVDDERGDAIAARDANLTAIVNSRLGVDAVAVEARSVHGPDTAVPGAGPGLPGSIPAMTAAEAMVVLIRNERGRQGKLFAAMTKVKNEKAAAAVAVALEAGETGNAFTLSDGKTGSASRPASSAIYAAAKAAAAEAGGAVAVDAAAAPVEEEGDVEEEDEEEAPPDRDEAARAIQRVARGHAGRRYAARMMQVEMEFLGIVAPAAPNTTAAAREERLAAVAARRRAEASANRTGLTAALPVLHTIVLAEEGSSLRDMLKAERDAWLRNHMLSNAGEPPEEAAEFYTWKASLVAPPPTPAADAGKGGKEAPKDKGKGGKGEPVGEADKPPALVGPCGWSKSIDGLLLSFADLWVGKDESGNPEQKHDVEMAKIVVRPGVEAALLAEVDLQLADEIENLKASAAAGKKKKPAKKAKKPPKEKKKKEKPLPGAKLCAGMDTAAMLGALVEFRMVNAPRPDATLSSFVGGQNMVLSKYNVTDSAAQRHPITMAWVPADPSMAQVREVLLNAAVLPLGSTAVRVAFNDFCAFGKIGKGRAPRSLLLYGPPGAGKTHLAQSVATAAGALFINLSSGVTEGKCLEKGGQAKLLHLAFEVAKDPATGPTLIYIDQVEKMIPGAPAKGQPKPDPNGPVRFKKDLLTYLNSLTAEHAVFIIGASSEPWVADVKPALDCFDQFLYVPPLDHGSRLRMWKGEVARAVRTWEDADAKAKRAAVIAEAESSGEEVPPAVAAPTSALASALTPLVAGFNSLPLSSAAAAAPSAALPSHPWLDSLNYSALAAVTDGYTAGSIRSAVLATLTPRRMDRWAAGTPVVEAEFVAALSSRHKMYAEEAELFRTFTDAVTGLATARVKEDAGAAAKGKKK
jgi:hypothetical protein